MRSALLSLLFALAPGLAAAQSAAPQPPPGYEPVSGAGAAQAAIEAPPLVVAAYIFIWAGVLLYVVLLWFRQQRIRQELEDLTARLEEAAGE